MSHLKMTPMTEEERIQVSIKLQQIVENEIRDVWDGVEQGLHKFPSMEQCRPVIRDSLISIFRSKCEKAGL